MCMQSKGEIFLLLHLVHMFEEGNCIFIMFPSGGNIEIFSMTLSAEMLRPTNLLSVLFLAHTDISMT